MNPLNRCSVQADRNECARFHHARTNKEQYDPEAYSFPGVYIHKCTVAESRCIHTQISMPDRFSNLYNLLYIVDISRLQVLFAQMYTTF